MAKVGCKLMATVPCIDDDRRELSVRALVVEDYEPFRRFVCSTLGKIREFKIVGESSDGLDAVQKAQDLQPDLIVLDVGLPTLNGIDAARRMRQLSPESKILFVSQETSDDVVQEALRLGALGYIVKTHAACELLTAMQAVCQGHTFIGQGVAGLVRTQADPRGHSTTLP
jgi:DNA-binding NarL/FixJ family response regulator